MAKITNNNSLIIFLPIFVACFNMYGMEEDNHGFAVVPVSQSVFEEPLFFTELSFEGQVHVAGHIFKNQSFQNIAKTFRCLAVVDKQSNELINDPGYTKRLIDGLSMQFQCSNEEVARDLLTEEAKKVASRQNKLFTLCSPRACPSLKHCNDRYLAGNNLGSFIAEEELRQLISQGKDVKKCIQVHQLEKLCQEGGDLEFTYNRKNYPKNVRPFMALCSTGSRAENEDGLREIMQFFIRKHREGHVDINAVNGDGINAFMLTYKTDSNKEWAFEDLCKVSTLVHVNHQDVDGNTALLHYLLNDSIHPHDRILDKFIEAGANPELGNNAGLTPLKRLEELRQQDGLVVQNTLDYFKSVLEQKHAIQQ